MARKSALRKPTLDRILGSLWENPLDLGGFSYDALRELFDDRKGAEQARQAPLMTWAVWGGAPEEELFEVLTWLLDQGVNPNLSAEAGPAPVTAVAGMTDVGEAKRVALIRRMVEAGADSADVPLGPIANALGYRPSQESLYDGLFLALERHAVAPPSGADGDARRAQVCELLSRIEDLTAPRPGWAPALPLLHDFARRGPWPVELLLDRGVDVNLPMGIEGVLHVSSVMPTSADVALSVVRFAPTDTPLDLVGRQAAFMAEKLPALEATEPERARHAIDLLSRLKSVQSLLVARGGVERTRSRSGQIAPSFKVAIDEALLSLAPFAEDPAAFRIALDGVDVGTARALGYLNRALDTVRPLLDLERAVAAQSDRLMGMLLKGDAARYSYGVAELGRSDVAGYPDEARAAIAQGTLIAHSKFDCADGELWFAKPNGDGTAKVCRATRATVETLAETIPAFIALRCRGVDQKK